MSVCGSWLLAECQELSCCESYRFRLYILLFSVLCVLSALAVGAIWLLFEFRPKYRSRNRLRRTDSEQARIESKSFEETKYLRRFSELNPLAARRHSFENC